MNGDNSRPYYLLHITSHENYDRIDKVKKILVSKHDTKKGKIQWLGDGIYFWDPDDDDALKLGKNLVKGKSHKNECVGIYINVDIEKNKHMNLENDSWYQLYMKFIKKCFPERYSALANYMEIIKTQDKIDTQTLNEVGEITGTTINFFVKTLFEKERIDIDMISGYFYHGKNKSVIFKRNEKMIRQFCIKKGNLVNDTIENWIVKYNI